MPETVLVTGGSGYVAGWCIVELLQRGCHVRTTVRSRDKEEAVTAAVATQVDTADRLGFAVADLTADDGWDAAVKGVDHVLHVASPLGGNVDGNADAMIAPARDGALRVLRAACGAGVRRVVMTSAANTASPSSYATEGTTDETLWTDPDDPTLIPYRRSKTLAERAAWDFMAAHDGPTELTTVLPGAVFGPILAPGTTGSVDIVRRMLTGTMRGVPRIGLEIVDVRDLADIHLRAMTSPRAAGERFLATGEFTWMLDMARALREELGEAGRRVSTRQIPDLAVRFAARFLDPSLRDITPALGRRNRHSTAKAHRILEWQPRPARETVVDCGRSLVAHGAV
ncbi:NAD-dependent epimerase/dehydratase family protein [Streptomyces beijiangensis]|uniref:NAD-dependent epimerase/dehydratase family protein n=1 Tax=Streptomyces beijiangensis TaxID=163361 RepID=A0A939FDR2_9ACTN|nr:NAD-dependent epimerase/dehydratase family protein [Streptomyces beijiangensis]MBO0516234.1 NAD-dependent epimerase/dehydratase family protein [Streptomyces beijiangensis]